MSTYKYKVSIIVPVYNAEQYIHKCVESIVNQSMDSLDYEVLLLDDGSSDLSLDICKKYSEMYPMFKVITKENEGVSKTRNLGLCLAQGKYVMFLDSDDTCSKNTFENIYNFFEANYDKADLVTYPLYKYDETGKRVGQPHFRYNYLVKTGVYDLSKTPFIVQTTMNICVKNEKEKVFFDENMKVHEDQDFITRIVMKKNTIGFVKEAEYCYIQHSSSVMNSISAIDLWMPTIAKYEELFSAYESVPKYLQALFFNDIKWKLVSDILYPSHLSDEEFSLEIQRLVKLLNKVDVDIIMSHPDTDVFHRFYWLSMKSNSELVTCAEDNEFSMLSGNNIIYRRNKVELIIHRILNFNNKPYILACVKSPLFAFDVTPKVYAYENTKRGITKRQMELFESVSSYYKTRVKTNRFLSFYYECDAENVDSVKFMVEIDGFEYEVSYYLMPSCQMKSANDISSYANNFTEVYLEKNQFKFSKVEENSYREKKKQQTNLMKNSSTDILNFRKMVLESKKDSEVWLYYDCKGVNKDNGYYQFIHDIEKQDGIKRYYVSDNSKETQDEVFDEELKKHVVQFGSFYHKLLYANADKIIVAFIEENNYCPFSQMEVEALKDLFQYQIVYLQHGILHAHMPWKYSPEKINIDKVVVSSHFEVENFVNIYGFHQDMLIKSGMPRFDHFKIDEEPKNKILFAPTWRKYLIGNCVNNVWQLKEKTFTESKYYKKIMSVLTSEKLLKVLEEHNVTIDLKLHPIFQPYSDLFQCDSKYINILKESQKDDEYKVFITDFSSYVFDFAYRKMNILYFVPDLEEFKVGLNGYRKLDLPFEEAFGDFITEEEDLVDKLIDMIQRDFVVEKKYKDRMDSFYLPLKDCCEKIYQEMIKK